MSDLMSDVLTFLKLEHQAETTALAVLNPPGRTPVIESDGDAMKLYRAREALIARLEAATTKETPAQHAARNKAKGCNCGSDSDTHTIWCAIGSDIERVVSL